MNDRMSEQAPPPQRLDLNTQTITRLLNQPPNNIPWHRIDRETDPVKKTQLEEKYDKIYWDDIETHKQENRQMKSQLTENPNETQELYSQIGNELSATRQQMGQLIDQITQSPENAYAYQEQKQTLEQQMIDQSTALGFVRAFIPID